MAWIVSQYDFDLPSGPVYRNAGKIDWYHPPEIVVISITYKGAMYKPPRNWRGHGKHLDRMDVERFIRDYVPTDYKYTRWYKICEICGFNTLYGGVCLKCMSEESKRIDALTKRIRELTLARRIRCQLARPRNDRSI